MLIVDEISMMSPQTLEVLNYFDKTIKFLNHIQNTSHTTCNFHLMYIFVPNSLSIVLLKMLEGPQRQWVECR